MFRSMSPSGYFGTGVALGVLIGVFAGFMAHSILRPDPASNTANGIDTALDRMDGGPADDQRLERAPADLWDENEDARTAPPPTIDADEETDADGEKHADDAPDAADDPHVHGQQELPDWPAEEDGTDAEVRSGEEDAEDIKSDGPTPGGARLPEDPDASFDAPED